MENTDMKAIEFLCNIRKTSKGSWYITIPKTVRQAIEWRKDKLFKARLEKF